jgi:hypothetical protein
VIDYHGALTKPRVLACALAVALPASFAVEGGDGRHTTCLERLSLRMTHPSRYTVHELEGDWYAATYEMSDAQAEPGYAVSIVLSAHTPRSIGKSVKQCTEASASPEASGDIPCTPTLATYETRRQLLKHGASRSGATVLTFHGRPFAVDELHGEGLHLRTYSTFFEDLMLEVTFSYGIAPGPDPHKAAALLSQLSFEKRACGRRTRL